MLMQTEHAYCRHFRNVELQKTPKEATKSAAAVPLREHPCYQFVLQPSILVQAIDIWGT